MRIMEINHCQQFFFRNNHSNSLQLNANVFAFPNDGLRFFLFFIIIFLMNESNFTQCIFIENGILTKYFNDFYLWIENSLDMNKNSKAFFDKFFPWQLCTILINYLSDYVIVDMKYVPLFFFYRFAFIYIFAVNVDLDLKMSFDI